MFASDTDTEVIAHLIAHRTCRRRRTCSTPCAQRVRRAARRLRHRRGQRSRAAARRGRARRARRCCWAWASGENFAASDASALLQVTQRMIYLEDGDCRRDHAATATASSTPTGTPVERPVHVSAALRRRGRARHLPPLHAEGNLRAADGASPTRWRWSTGAQSIVAAAVRRRGRATCFATIDGGADPRLRHQLPRRHGRPLLDRGDRRHARAASRSPANTATATRCPIRETLVVTISQSGETADTLAALQHAKSLGHAAHAVDLQRARIGAGARIATCAS